MANTTTPLVAITKRKAAHGMSMILTVIIIMVGLMVSAIAVDISMAYAGHAHLQSAADAAALAGAQELNHSDGADGGQVRADARVQANSLIGEYNSANNPVAIDTNNDITFGYIDPEGGVYDEDNFDSPSADPNYAFTGGYNAVHVRVRRTDDSPAGAFPTLMANLFGIDDMNIQAEAVAMMDNSMNVVTGGLRPLYGCLAQYDAAVATGNLEGQTARLYGDHHSLNGNQVAGCGDHPSGNWGFADLRDDTSGAPGNSTLGDWFENGYTDSEVVVGGTYSTQPGNSISSSNVKTALQALIDNQTVISIPLVNWDESSNGSNTSGGNGKGKGKGNGGGSGSNVSVEVQAFTGFVITNMKTNGNQSSRYIEGYFTSAECSGSCNGGGSGSSQGGGLFKLRLLN